MALQFADVGNSPFTRHLRRMLFLAFSTSTKEVTIEALRQVCEDCNDLGRGKSS